MYLLIVHGLPVSNRQIIVVPSLVLILTHRKYHCVEKRVPTPVYMSNRVFIELLIGYTGRPIQNGD